MTDEI